MKKQSMILATIHPFVLDQDINVYINEECVKTLECPLTTMGETLYHLAEQYDITDIHFQGGKPFALKFKDELVSNKFGNKHIEVHIH